MSPPAPHLSLHHLALCTRDLAAAERFYVDVLGLSVITRHRHPDGTPRSTWLSLGAGAFLALEAVSGGAARDDDGPGLHCLALGIEASEREAWRERLEAAGHAIERESAFTLYVRDPDGVLVGLSHHPHPTE